MPRNFRQQILLIDFQFIFWMQGEYVDLVEVIFNQFKKFVFMVAIFHLGIGLPKYSKLSSFLTAGICSEFTNNLGNVCFAAVFPFSVPKVLHLSTRGTILH